MWLGFAFLKAGSHDPIYGSVFSLALFQLIEMLIRVTNFFNLSKNRIRKLDRVNQPSDCFMLERNESVNALKITNSKFTLMNSLAYRQTSTFHDYLFGLFCRRQRHTVIQRLKN